MYEHVSCLVVQECSNLSYECVHVSKSHSNSQLTNHTFLTSFSTAYIHMSYCTCISPPDRYMPDGLAPVELRKLRS